MKQLFVFLLVLGCSSTVLSQVTIGVSVKKHLKQKTSSNFVVDDVEPATDPLKTNNFVRTAEAMLQHEILAFAPEMENENLIFHYEHGLISAVHWAYADHRPLILTPDDIWLTLLQGLAHHIALNSEELEDQLFTANRPEVISVRNDSLVNGDSKDWATLIDQFSEEVSTFTKEDVERLFAPSFTTSTPNTNTAYKVCLLEAFETYFSYYSESGCGIPSITLEGTLADWQKIYDDVEQFRDFGMGYWVDELKPILLEFVLAAKGKENVEFWQEIYKHTSYYMANFMSGWLIKLFPYIKSSIMLKDGEWETANELKESYEPNPYLKGRDYLLSKISASTFPDGFVEVPFTWTAFPPLVAVEEKRNMILAAGFMGLRQDSTLAIRTNITWCVYEDSEEEFEVGDELEVNYLSWKDQLSHGGSWYADMRTEATALPVYNPKKNNSYETGLENFKKDILKISKNIQEIEITVAFNGQILVQNIVLNDGMKADTKALIAKIEEQTKRWSPALAPPFDNPKGVPWPLNYTMVITI